MTNSEKKLRDSLLCSDEFGTLILSHQDRRITSAHVVKYKDICEDVELSFSELINKLVNRISPESLHTFEEECSESQLIAQALTGHKSTFLLDVRGISDSTYITYQVHVAPYRNECLIVNFWPTDANKEMLADASKILYYSYIKIVKFNASTGEYKEIRCCDSPDIISDGYCLLARFADSRVFYQDRSDFKAFTSRESLQSMFKSSEDSRKILRYRRLASDGSCKWSTLEAVPCEEYTSENKQIMLYVRNIQDDYTFQISEQRKLFYLSTHDPQTGFKNSLAYADDATKISLEWNTLFKILIYSEEGSTGRVSEVAGYIKNYFSRFQYAEIYRTESNELTVLAKLSVTEGQFIENDLRGKLKDVNIGMGHDDNCNINLMTSDAEYALI